MSYIMNLRYYLKYEARKTTERFGGVYDYTQKKFAFHSISRTGG